MLAVWALLLAASAAAQTPPYIATSANFFCAGRNAHHPLRQCFGV